MGFYAVTTFISVSFRKFSNLDLDKVRENIGNEWTVYIILYYRYNRMGGDFSMNQKEEKKLYEMLDLIEKQDETLRKVTGEEQYVDISKDDRVIIRTNDKKAMKFWEE